MSKVSEKKVESTTKEEEERKTVLYLGCDVNMYNEDAEKPTIRCENEAKAIRSAVAPKEKWTFERNGHADGYEQEDEGFYLDADGIRKKIELHRPDVLHLTFHRAECETGDFQYGLQLCDKDGNLSEIYQTELLELLSGPGSENLKCVFLHCGLTTFMLPSGQYSFTVIATNQRILTQGTREKCCAVRIFYNQLTNNIDDGKSWKASIEEAFAAAKPSFMRDANKYLVMPPTIVDK